MAKVSKPKTTQVKTNNVITPIGRASYVHVWEMAERLNGSMAYSIMILFPKATTDMKALRASVNQAAADFFGPDKNKWPKNLISPIKDGDEKAQETGEDIYKGMWFINPWTGKAPGIVGPDAKPIFDQDEFYSGCWCRASINFAGYQKGGNQGVGVYLNNLMKIKDDDRLDGRKNAEAEFGEYATEESPESFAQNSDPNAKGDDIPF